jgi:hypothetical protein
MRIITLSLIMTCVACAQAPQPVMKQKAQPASTPTVVTQPQVQAETETAQDATVAQPAAVEDQIQAADVAAMMESSAGNPAAMDMVAMEEQVQAVFAQSNLGPEKSAAMSDKTMALIAAVNAGDQAAATKLSNQLAKEALGGKGLIPGIPGFGLVDVAGIVAAIMDLIAAVVAVDVAGILAALMDIVAALGA